MMNSAKEQNDINPPKPGTITFLEGEILSVKISQWGIQGEISTKYGTYNYKLQDSSSLANNILIGLKLTIKNGYCFENKQRELVLSDGKFGKIRTEIDMDQFYHNSEKGIITTGKILEIHQDNGTMILQIEQSFPPDTNQEIYISSNISNIDIKSKNFQDLFIGKISKIEGSGSFENFELKSIKLLAENHFLNMISNMKQDNLETYTTFDHIILHQIQHIDSFHDSFKNILINMGKKISKTLLTELKEVLQSKIFDGSVKFPDNILIPHSDIEEYFDTMLTFLRNIINSGKTSDNPEDLVTILKFHYPAYTGKNMVKNN